MSPKRPKDSEIRKIREQLQGATASSDLPYDLRWALRILLGEHVATPEVVRQEVMLGLTEELVSRKDIAALTWLAKQSHREASKSARTGLHRLRSQKIEIEIPINAPEETSGTGLTLEAELKSLITMYYGQEQRAVWFSQEAPRGIYIHQAIISAEHGLVDFKSLSSTRKRFRQHAKRIRNSMTAELVDADLARWFIEDAARRCQEAEHGLPEAYVRSSQLLGSILPRTEHPALAITPAQTAPTHLNEILEWAELKSWLPERLFLQRLFLRIQEVSTSRIMLNEQQRTEQKNEILIRAIGEYFTPQRCKSARQILLDTAHLLAIGGKMNQAALVRAAAEVFAQPPERVVDHPFPRSFIERFVQRKEAPPEEADEPTTSDEGLIISK